MTIIDAWRKITTCKDCCKAEPKTTINDEGFWCSAIPVNPTWSGPLNRCDSGVWLFKEPGRDGWWFSLDLAEYLELQSEMSTGWKLKIIPREEWPECPE